MIAEVAEQAVEIRERNDSRQPNNQIFQTNDSPSHFSRRDRYADFGRSTVPLSGRSL